MTDFFYLADGKIIENMSNDNYYLDGSLKVAGSVISNKFVNEAGEPIGLPKNVDIKGSLKARGSTELEKTLIKKSLNVDGSVNIKKILKVDEIHLGNVKLTGKKVLKIQNNSGTIEIGAMNKNYGHIYTDRPKFAINKDLVDVKNTPHVNYIKYSADGGLKIQDYNLSPRNTNLLVKNSKTNKVSMTIHRDGTVSLVNKLQQSDSEKVVSTPPTTPPKSTTPQKTTRRNYNKIIKNTDYVGNDLSYHNNQTIDSCKKLCDNNASCAGFLYHRGNNSCWLKNNKVNNPTKFDGLDFYTTADFNPPKLRSSNLIIEITNMNPMGWFDANNFNPNKQKWVSSSGNYTISTTNVIKSNSPFPLIIGGTNSTITNIPWPGRNRDYTFIHVAKYNGNTRGRIWTGIGGNWLSGFWNGGVAFFHEGWYDNNINASNSGKDWLLSVDMNNFVRVNRGTYQKNGPAFSPNGIAVSSGPYGNEKSDFAIAEFLIFNRKLSQAEYTKVEEYLAKKYGLFGSAKDPSLSPILQFSLTNIANDVKAGKYNNIRNSDFIISNNLNFWKLRTEFTSNDYYNSWQSIVGNMYNNEISGRGWGLWVNPQGIFHWSESSSTVNLNNLGRLQNNVSYRLDIVFNNNRYTFTLTNLSNNTQKSETINRGSSIITDRGFVTIGGAWRNVSSERFKGSINSMIVSTNNFN